MILILIVLLVGDPANMLPTPYTAAQIRQAHPNETVVKTKITAADNEVSYLVIRFHDGNETEIHFTSQPCSETGEAVGESSVSQATWEDLRQHALFPASSTKRSEVELESVFGKQACWLYEVQQPDGLMRLWFSKSMAGAPILVETYKSDLRQLRVETIEKQLPQ